MKRRELLKWSLGAGSALGVATLAGAAPLCAGKTPAQTEGPFYPVADQIDKDWDLTFVKGITQKAQGEEIVVLGQVSDQNCQPLKETLVEIWQACASGKYNHPNDPNNAPLDKNFQYWGRAMTNEEGFYLFKTILPGDYPADTHWIRPPHIHYKVQKWGFRELTTQLYFAGNKYNDTDHILNQIPRAERGKVVRPIELQDIELPGEQRARYPVVRFDIVLTKA